MPNYRDDTVESAILNDDKWLKVMGPPTTESAILNDVFGDNVRSPYLDAAVLNDAYLERRSTRVVEAAVLNDAITSSPLAAETLVVESAVLNDAIRSGYEDKAVEAAVLNDAADLKGVTSRTVESAVFNDVGDRALTFQRLVVEAAVLNDAIRSKRYDFVAEAAILNDALRTLARLRNLVSESALLDDAMPGTGVSKSTLTVDSAQLNDTTKQELSGVNLLVEVGYLGDDHRGGVGTAWTAPTDTMFMSRFTNFGFVAMAEVNGRLVGVNHNGAFLLEGGDDDGVDIDAVIQHDWTTAVAGEEPSDDKLKRPRYAYMTGKFGGVVALVLGYTENGNRQEERNEFDSTVITGRQNIRTALSRGIRSIEFRPRIENVDGASFQLDGGLVVVDVLERSV